MAQKVLFKRKTTSEIEDLEVEDGSLIYNVENGKTYMDYGDERIPTGGGANGGIYVGDTEPTDPDITLWVDTPTSETKASEIVDEYTESDTVGYSTNYINDCNKYSTDETFTGKHWTDGKKIYKKTFTFTSLTNSTDNTLGTIANLNYVTDISGIANQGGERLTLPHSDYRGLEWAYGVVVDSSNNVKVRKGSFGTVTGASHVTVEYTKTTD